MNLLIVPAPHRLSCVFFSKICREKGYDIVLDVAENLRFVDFAFYGHIEKSIENEFLEKVEKLPNVHYCGVFTGNSDDTYRELSRYDVMLLPSRWKNEGVPGIIVESKIAGIPAVVSDVGYFKDIVTDGFDGYVVHNIRDNYINALYKLLSYNEKKNMKKNLKISSENFFIDHYIYQILSFVNEEETYNY